MAATLRLVSDSMILAASPWIALARLCLVPMTASAWPASIRVSSDLVRLSSKIAVTREALGDAGEGSLYWVDLIGLEVVSLEGERLGRVEQLFEAGDTSVLVLKDADAKEVMIPFVPDYVKSVDREARRITVDWKTEDGR